MAGERGNVKRISLWVVIVLLLSACKAPWVGLAPWARSAPHPAVRPSDVDWDDRTIFGAGLIAAQRAMLDRLPGATVYHMDLQLSDDLLLLQGHEQVRYTNQEDEPLQEIYFRLFPNVTGGETAVSAVQVDGQRVEPAYEAFRSAMRVPLATALQPGEQVVVEMDLAVSVPQEMGGNYGLFGCFEGVLVLDTFYPVIPVYDDEGWNVEVPSPNGDLTYQDASFYLVRLIAPARLTVVASGIAVGRERACPELSERVPRERACPELSEREGDAQVWTFAAGPARDFYLAASDRYTVVSAKVGETTVNSYALKEQEGGAELALRHAVDALESLNARLGTYPYTEFDVASTPMRALGIEYPGLVGISLRLYDPGEEVSGMPSQVVLESTVAHEVAHQWFYNVVGNDQADEPWLDEAIVQYVVGLYYVDVHGERAAQAYRASWQSRWDRVERAEIPIGMPTGRYAGQEYGAIVYGRGPFFVTALAEEMGQETFDAFLRDYVASHQWGIGTGEAFKELAERHCQCDLSSLFEEWVYERL